MPYKLLVTDMDGTLLNSKGEVSKENKEALQFLHDNNIHVAIATGRIYTTARIYGKYVGLVTPIICCNGAIVKNLKNDELIYDKPLSKDDCLTLVDIFKRKDIDFYFFDEETIYGEKLKSRILKFSEWGKTLLEKDRIKIEIVDDSRDIILTDRKIYKFGFQIDEPKKLKEIYDFIKDNYNFEVRKSRHNLVDIMNVEVSKGRAVERLAKSLGIKREEIIAIGDNENDISMLEFAGLGIAMGNAEKIVKASADYITDTNDNHGVAKVIRQFFKY